VDEKYHYTHQYHMLDVFPKIAKVPFFDKKISEKVCVALHYVEVEDGLIWSEMYHYPYIFFM